MKVDQHFIKEKLENELISMVYIPTEEQLFNDLTKGLLKWRLDYLTCKLGMQGIFELA